MTTQEIDLLVDGELDDEARRALLLRLDAEPDGWRRCALAFLEAQAWRGSLATYKPSAVIQESKSSQDLLVHRRLAPIRRVPKQAIWLARAAILILAFAVGWMVRPYPTTNVAKTPVANRPAATTPTVAATELTSVPSAPPVSYLRGRLEREGYQVEKRVFLVPGSTRDGRPVSVPVEQVKLRFVGNRAV